MKEYEVRPERQGRPAIIPVVGMATGSAPTNPGGTSGLSITNVYAVSSITSSITASSTRVLLANAGAASMILTLPAAADNKGRHYIIKKVDSSSHIVRIYTDELIDGLVYVDLTLQYSYISVVCDGNTWYVIGGMSVKLEEMVKNGMDEQSTLLNQLLMELKMGNLHLSSLSEENITSDDVEE